MRECLARKMCKRLFCIFREMTWLVRTQRPMLVQACGLLWKRRKSGTIQATEHRNQRRSTTIAMPKGKSCPLIG